MASNLFSCLPIKERTCGVKHLQFVSGVNVFSFWLTSFIWDYLMFCFTVFVTISTLAILQYDGWSSIKDFIELSVSLLAYGFAAIPLNFIMSLIFATPTGGFAAMSFISFTTGMYYNTCPLSF